MGEEDDWDLTVCHFDPRHTADRVPSTRILHYGPDDFLPACPECAQFFEDTEFFEDTDPQNPGRA
jgi:hypothetical protein